MSVMWATAIVVMIGSFLSLVLTALLKKDDVQTEFRVRPWSITFSLNARKRNRKALERQEGNLAPKNRGSASKP
jgi:hypothetical protein